MDAERNRQNTLDAIAAFNTGDLDRYLASYAPNAVIHGLPQHLEPTVSGHREFLTAMRDALPDVTSTVEDSAASADLVATRHTYRGTHEGVFHGARPTGQVLEWTAMTFRRFNDQGLVTERWIVSSDLALLRQLGQLGTPAASHPAR
ncbi:MAG: ester cyclase [Intrasporangium sp.]|uniref:ester cyclase n=1 Tax=Intrasporangium sp. TaxID=1925024 RepID=UPI002646FD9A|nr:ester cyclase [Intrasporangium sp.]MDN5797040.1 ester cyclase [Intrasporangium sp.]